MFAIGHYTCLSPIVLAPMAGVTDLPFRSLCKSLGAGLAVSEMVTSDPKLRHSKKTQFRLRHENEVEPKIIQIAGSEPAVMAEAAKFNVDQGAQIIDINMGCPAKKVCNKAAGSALLKDEFLVERILNSVVQAVNVPVTLKIRTGWDKRHINGITVAKIAQDSGIKALAVHGRTRACGYKGAVEYDTIAEIKRSVSIPIIANGDIDSPQKAKYVMDYTGADAVMIGRAAQGRPWIFREIGHFINTGKLLPAPLYPEIKEILVNHLLALYKFYGDTHGIKIARKHVGWYLQTLPKGKTFRKLFNHLESTHEQITQINLFFARLTEGKEQAA